MLLITNGLGSPGDGSNGQLMLTLGLGDTGAPQDLCANILLIGISNTSSTITISFSSSVTLTGNASLSSGWSISTTNGAPVAIYSLSQQDNLVTLQVSEQTDGANYSLHIPINGITSPYFQTYDGPFLVNFTGVAGAAGIINSVALDYNSIQILFSRPVIDSDALVPTNYSINNGITVLGVTKVSDQIYNLSTTRLHSSTTYNITIANIRDSAGNPI